MTAAEINQIVAEKAFPDSTEQVERIETHAAWVLLTDNYAYKIKRPVRFSFLDFSSIEKREFFCRRELELNRRLDASIYLRVLPVKERQGTLFIGEKEGKVIDYCLQMKRVDNQKEMSRLLELDAVGPKQIQQVARKIAQFHQNATIIKQAFDPDTLFEQFSDITSVKSILVDCMGAEAANLLDKMIDTAQSFIDIHKEHFGWRYSKAYVRDVHGDLHSGNIFLLEEPLIFDCIEFNDDFRQMDVLDEVAFLCMDLEYHQKDALSATFLETYLQEFPCMHSRKDQGLFLFFKWYRACIRLKVNCLDLQSKVLQDERACRIARIQRYYMLFKRYYQLINASCDVFNEA